MSNLCEHCRCSPLQKTGLDACPFNALHRDFHGRHAELLRGNPRVGRTIQNWEARSEVERRTVRGGAGQFSEGM